MWQSSPISSKCWQITFAIVMESFGESEALEFFHQNRVISSVGYEQNTENKRLLAEDYFQKYLESEDAEKRYPTAMHIVIQPYENGLEMLPAYISTWEGDSHISHTKTEHQVIVENFLQEIGLLEIEDEY